MTRLTIACIETPRGDYKALDMLKDGLNDEIDDVEYKTPFMMSHS